MATKLPGVGFRLGVGTIVQTEASNSSDREGRVVNLKARITTGSYAEKAARYREGESYVGRQAIGMEQEAFQRNRIALESWFLARSAMHRDRYDGRPTLEEMYDLAHTQPRRGSFFYQQWLYTALPKQVKEETWKYYGDDVREAGVTTLGLHKGGEDFYGYQEWLDVQWLPEGWGEEEPPAPPPPPPEPEPPPFPPIGPYLSTVEQSAAEWIVWIGDHLKGWAPRWVKLGWKALEPDPRFRSLVRLAVRIKRRLLGETEGWGRPS